MQSLEEKKKKRKTTNLKARNSGFDSYVSVNRLTYMVWLVFFTPRFSGVYKKRKP